MKAIIIGAGIGSLGLSIRLAARGIDVEVFEANRYVGGKLHEIALGQFRFDGGPSLFTMPQFVDELFALTGKNPGDYFVYEKLEEACRYFWEDGASLLGYSDPEKFAAQAAQKFDISKSVLEEYFQHIENIYQHSGKIFLEKSLHKASTWLSKETALSMLKISQFDLAKSMNRANKIRIGEPHLVQLFNRFATYNGSNPYKAPGILNVIPWFEHGFGTYAPKGGMQQIPRALHKLACELGVKFHLNSCVNKIMHRGNMASGIEANGSHHPAEIVVSNADVFFTYRNLLPSIKAPERKLTQERSSSAVVFYWGMAKSFPELGLHNILFSNDYKTEFESIFAQKRISEDPTIYINVSSKINQDDAPKGCENWFVMVNAPADTKANWNEEIPELKSHIIKKVNRILNYDISKHIKAEKIWTPKAIEADTRSYLGALYGTSSNSQLAAFLRHPNFSGQLKNLYFCGGSVHPGGGIPLALLSAKITADLISHDQA